MYLLGTVSSLSSSDEISDSDISDHMKRLQINPIVFCTKIGWGKLTEHPTTSM
jgi:hypothetical protein